VVAVKILGGLVVLVLAVYTTLYVSPLVVRWLFMEEF